MDEQWRKCFHTSLFLLFLPLILCITEIMLFQFSSLSNHWLLLPANQSLGVLQLSLKNKIKQVARSFHVLPLGMTLRCVSHNTISFQNPSSVSTVLCFTSCKCLNSECASHGIHQLSVPNPSAPHASWYFHSPDHKSETRHIFYSFVSMGGRIMTPKGVYILILRTYEHVRLQGKGEFRWKMELRLLSSWPWAQEISPDQPVDSMQSTQALKCGNGRQKSSVRWCDMKKTQQAIAGFEDGGRGKEPRDVSSLWKLKMIKKHAPIECPEPQPCR